jgi:transcriptional regulator with XRE-family HTH domain
MSGNKANTSESSTSTLSVKKRTKKIQTMLAKPGASLTEYGQAAVLSGPSSSRLAEVYKTDEFTNEWANDVQSHVARNILHLRRFRGMSQSAVAQAAGTSQSAVARIESAQENITLDTLRRLIVALKGRFCVSIPPQERALQPQRPWWESSEADSGREWKIKGSMHSQTTETEQLILGLERSRFAETLPKASYFLEERKTS